MMKTTRSCETATTTTTGSSRRTLLASAYGVVAVLLLATTIPQCHGFGLNRLPASRSAAIGSSITVQPVVPLSSNRQPPVLHMAVSDGDDDDNDAPKFSSPLDRPIVAAVDFVALLIFAGVGKASHAADGSIDILAVLSVAFPFLLSWYATSPLTGIYDAKTRNKQDSALINEAKIAAKGWIVAVPIGIALRGVIKGYVPPTPFIVVTMIATLVILCGSRVAFSVVEDFFVELVN